MLFFMDSLLINSPYTALSHSNLLTSNSISYSSFSLSSFWLFRFKRPKKLKASSVTVLCSNRQNPNQEWQEKSLYLKPFSLLVPLFKKVRDFAAKSKWCSVFKGCSGTEEELSGDLLQNGSFGMALLSITATAKVKISPFVATLAANPTFVSGFVAWFMAQSMKVFLNFCVERKWDFRIMFASGGMPSSHSALCTALTTSVAICHGVADSLFPVCLGFTLIVMYDAIGVRRHAGMQAEVLNLIVEDLFQGHPISQRKLKELLGHTPSQVFAGALLGIMVAWMCSQGCLIAL
ncbi:hypothetical protein FXO38_19803 [Capsicum annuum]|uniref:uncharacterized protein LOC107839310 n=1 Tax=Capsicum annuum TaxID=4072 RepID=UPI001FB17E2E|nr:uncharacterized protein LOC107839310 [Capsicum annuum]KAF3645174.1 hypothetical protein FXO38_19803 [Capsicum annuum]